MKGDGMITLVTGGSGSGKSAYAEDVAVSCEGTEKYYIATMQIYDAEGERKVERHRKLRAGKGFLTVESPVDVGLITFPTHEDVKPVCPDCGEPEHIREKQEQRTALLECMSNLVANEMFSTDGMREEDAVVAKVVQDVEALATKLDHLVIVTNNVFEDGITYDEGTMAYLRALGRINTTLAKRADRVVEVVVGIPIILKESAQERAEE